MSVLVTGATGVAGYNLVEELCRAGEPVRVLLRNNDPMNGLLAELPRAERVYGSLSDPNSLRQALKGCRAAYHTEEANPFGYCPPGAMRETNVQGSRNLFQAALDRGVQRVLHLSSAFTVASGTPQAPASERSAFDLAGLKDPYIESKRAAEAEARAYVRKGLPIVVLNPGLLMGPGNRQSTLGSTLLRFNSLAARAVPAGATLVSDARDVARVSMMALREGEPGERYIVGTRSMRYHDLMGRVDQILGVEPPAFYMPRLLALLVGRITDAYARISGSPLALAPSVSTVKRMYVDLFASPEKATVLWGVNWTPVGEILQSSIQWQRQNRLM